MILSGSRLDKSAVMSLQTGSRIAIAHRPVVDPARLQIIAFELRQAQGYAKQAFLRVLDVREFSDIGMIIDSADEFVGLDDILKLKEIYQLNFQLPGMRVIGTDGKYIGKVRSYTIESDGFYIAQLIIKPQIFTRLRETELLVHRSQIREITDDAIIIERLEELKEDSRLLANASYVNPFRPKTSPEQPEAINPGR